MFSIHFQKQILKEAYLVNCYTISSSDIASKLFMRTNVIKRNEKKVLYFFFLLPLVELNIKQNNKKWWNPDFSISLANI